MAPHIHARGRSRAGNYRHMPQVLRELFDKVDAAELTYAQVCRKAGISTSALSNWATGVSSPTLQSLLDTGVAMGLRLVWEPIPEIEKARKKYVEFVPPDPGRDSDPEE